MTILNALNGLVSDVLDRLAERVASRPRTHEEIHLRTDTHLVDPSGGRALIAKMARSEVKNYLAELAEQAGVPFTSPVGFITMSHDQFLNLADYQKRTCCETQPGQSHAGLCVNSLMNSGEMRPDVNE